MIPTTVSRWHGQTGLNNFGIKIAAALK